VAPLNRWLNRRASAAPTIAGAVVGVALAWLLTGSATSLAARAPEVAAHGPRNVHEVALTFDDGISPQNCRRILAILVTRGVPATFFPVGQAMRLDPAFWRLVAEAGYPVGDHTMTHPQLPALSGTAQLAQIDDMRRLGESILGRPLLRVVRPPSGAYDPATLAAAAKAGFGTALLWDTSDRDTSPQGTVAEMLAAGERGTNGSVVLLHCGPNATPHLLASLIDDYRARGFRFVTVPQLLGVPWSAGPTRHVTPAEILDGLSPLPSSSTGGPIIGPNGIGPLTFPTASPTRGTSPSPSPRPRPSRTATTPSPAPTGTPSPSPTSMPTLAAVLPTPAPAGPRPEGVRSSSMGLALPLALGLGIGGLTVLLRRVTR
jgi:peptidoglycan/xylan/chitin deacetylase (PgdA/CDA1 family)